MRYDDRLPGRLRGRDAKPSGDMARRSGLRACVILVGIWLVTLFVLLFLDNSIIALVPAGLSSALVLLAWCMPEQMRRIADLCFRYRWALALLLFCVCVLLRLHGSSIGVYDEVFSEQVVAGEATLFGTPRWIRSDEFGVATPTFFSQAFNEYGLYSTQMSLSPTNMVLDYYAPVWDLFIVGKPLAWGYLLFGNEVGLSWYWCGLEILLFMTAFETCLLLTGGSRCPSLLGAVMVVLSPEVQWWVLPHMPVVVMYAMGLLCIGYELLSADSRLMRWAMVPLTVIFVTGFSLSIFPAYQVPCAYVVVALLAACLVRDRDRVSFAGEDALRVLLAAGISAAIVVRFVIQSWDDLLLLLNTTYPGARMLLGGGTSARDLFTDVACLFFPFKDATYLNNCEAANYVHFAPFFVLLAPRMLMTLGARGERGVVVGVTLLGLLAAEVVYMMVGVPETVAAITMLRFCNRMHGIYGWTATLFTVWGISMLADNPDVVLGRARKVLYPVAYGALAVLSLDGDTLGYFAQLHPSHAGMVLLACALLALVCVLLLATHGELRLAAVAIMLAMVVSGATVNPVERGVGAMTNHPISSTISRIVQEEPEARWLCCDCTFFLSNYLMANGARVLDATNFYPDQGKWDVIDPSGTFDEVTNRYANMSATVVEGESRVELLNPDCIKLYLDFQMLETLGARYLLSTVDYTEPLASHGISCELVGGQDGYGIYRLSYDDDPPAGMGG